jgi:hypothetical protein
MPHLLWPVRPAARPVRLRGRPADPARRASCLPAHASRRGSRACGATRGGRPAHRAPWARRGAASRRRLGRRAAVSSTPSATARRPRDPQEGRPSSGRARHPGPEPPAGPSRPEARGAMEGMSRRRSWAHGRAGAGGKGLAWWWGLGGRGFVRAAAAAARGALGHGWSRAGQCGGARVLPSRLGGGGPSARGHGSVCLCVRRGGAIRQRPTGMPVHVLSIGNVCQGTCQCIRQRPGARGVRTLRCDQRQPGLVEDGGLGVG